MSNFQNINDNWVNNDTFDFLKSLSFNDYILAGNAVSNMFEQIPLQGDLDFWVSKNSSFINTFREMSKYYTVFNIYPSMIEMIDTNNILPTVNLIYTNLHLNEIVSRFDFAYCKCSWTPQTGIRISNETKKSILSKQITSITPDNPFKIMHKRLLKAIKYGYNFNIEVWESLHYLVLNKRKLSDEGFINITESDLDMSRFEQLEMNITVTDKFNIDLTIKELTEQYNKCMLTPNVKLPILLTFSIDEIDTIEKYIRLNINYVEYGINISAGNLYKDWNLDAEFEN